MYVESWQLGELSSFYFDHEPPEIRSKGSTRCKERCSGWYSQVIPRLLNQALVSFEWVFIRGVAGNHCFDVGPLRQSGTYIDLLVWQLDTSHGKASADWHQEPI